MVKRFHVDNFRCLINFEVELDELNLFLGPNGSGKTSVLDALRRLQAVITRDAKVDAVFGANDLSFALN
ncbi:MAG: AAA family ATPase, partial [Acidobacteria bacterium]|nr:AAA family ATPase [Acidobacteriota bacterium]